MIDLQGVTKTYPSGVCALDGIDLHIEKGEFVFVVGHSGAGKSTLIKMLLREEVPNAGEVTVNGRDLIRMKQREIPYFRRTIGVVFQDFRLIPTMTVFDNVAFALQVTGVPRRFIRRRVPYILNLLGLDEKYKHYPPELSGGEQQRVALARALVNNPDLLIADEPTGNIDPELSYEIVELLDEINKTGTTILMVTHEHELVNRFHHRTVTLEKGGLKAIISGQGLAGGKAWNGTLTMEETLQPYAFAAHRAVQVAPLREGLSLAPQHPAHPAYTEALAVLALPRRAPLRLAALSEKPRRELVQKFWTFTTETQAEYDPALVLTENDRFALRHSFTAQGAAHPIDSGSCTALTVDTTAYLRVEGIEVNW